MENEMLHKILDDAGISIWKCQELDCYGVYWSVIKSSDCGEVNCDQLYTCGTLGCNTSKCDKHWMGDENCCEKCILKK